MSTFWEIVASNAVVATVLALGILLLGRFWKNAAALHVLWVVVLLKLFTPPLMSASLPFAPRLLPNAASVGLREKTSDRLTLSKTARVGPVAPTNRRGMIAEDDRQDMPFDPPSEAAGSESWSLTTILAAIWLGGAFGTALVYAACIRRFARAIGNFEAAPPALCGMVAQVASRLGLRRVPDVLMTTQALPPLVWSIGTSPSLILPSRLFARLSREAQSTILAHELVHIRRGDHLVRLLELAATTVFWWHPVAWLAGRQLRELEEQCCDGRVLELLPDRPRTYATALVDTLEFLAGETCRAVPLRTAIDPIHSLSRRIQMLTQRQTNRLSALSLAFVAGLVAFPLAIAFAVAPEQASKAAPEIQQPPVGASVAVLRGRVTTMAGAPLPGARVLVAIPATDMRFVNPSTDHKRVETTTDAHGDYELKIPEIAKKTKISIDVMMPGFRKLVGTLMMAGDAKDVDVEPGATVEAKLALEPARYFGGVVVDEQGQPIPSVQVAAMLMIGRGTGGVEMTASNTDGSFELFNYFIEPPHEEGEEAGKGFVTFSHPDYIEFKLEDVYAIERDRSGEIRIVLPTGRKVTGTVLDVAGKPVPKAMVEVVSQAKGHRKATLTDANGKFALRGLDGGPTKFSARSLEIKQKFSQPMTLDNDKADFEVRLQAISMPATLKKYNVLGMQLTDMTPELKAAYEIQNKRGVLLLDPGQDFARLEIGDLTEGNCFWLVGEKQVGSVREFVDQILTEAGDRDAGPGMVRVVYSFKTPEFVGTNTQYLKLTKDDIKQLQAVSDQLKADVR